MSPSYSAVWLKSDKTNIVSVSNENKYYDKIMQLSMKIQEGIKIY